MEIFEKFKHVISKSDNPIVLEFGTCEGDQTKIMIEHLKLLNRKFIYHAFEPNKNLKTDFYNRNGDYIKDGLLDFYEYAIGNIDGECDFHVSSGKKYEDGKFITSYHGSSSIKQPQIILREYPDIKFELSKTNVIKLDTHYNNSILKGKKIDFIWADVQGAEKDMIRGGMETFTNHVKYLYTEYIDGYSYSDKINISEILELLPYYEVVKDYGGDVLLKNTKL